MGKKVNSGMKGWIKDHKALSSIILLSALIFLGMFFDSDKPEYQCTDGSFAIVPENCPAPKAQDSTPQIQERIIERNITVYKYVCPNGKEVASKELCPGYIDPKYDLQTHKEELIWRLEGVEERFGNQAIKVTKIVISDQTVEMSYTNLDGSYQVADIGQTMWDVLLETIAFLEENNQLMYGVNMRVTASNGGDLFIRQTTKEEVQKITTYDLGMDEWIDKIRQVS